MFFHPQSYYTGANFQFRYTFFEKNNIEFQFFTYGITFDSVCEYVFSLTHLLLNTHENVVASVFIAFATHAN